MSNESMTDDINSKLAAAGLPTVTDKRGTVQKKLSREVEAYRCPFCNYTADSEMVVRGHVTAEDDAAHKDRNGYLDQLFVQAIDCNGNIVEDMDTDYSDPQRRQGEVTTELFPSDATENEIDIMGVLLVSPQVSTPDVIDRVRQRHGYEPSIQAVNKARAKLFNTDMSTQQLTPSDEQTTTDIPEPEKPYRRISKLQREIIDIIIDFEDPLDPSTWPRSAADVTAEAGTSSGSYYNLRSRYPNLIKHRKAQKERGELPEDEDDTEEDEIFACEYCEKEFDAPPKRDGHLASCPEKPAEIDGEDSEVGDTTQTEPEAPPTPADDEFVRVRRDTLRKHANRLETVQMSADAMQDSASRDSEMKVHADGQHYVAALWEEMIRDIHADAE